MDELDEGADAVPNAGRDSAGDVARIERLIEVLEGADAAFRSGSPARREAALAGGLSAISALYGGLDMARSPEASTHLAAAYDACLRALGDAYGGDADALTAAVHLARAVRRALGSRPSRAPSVRRAA